jgi:multiple sugar transport system ATP-binding protein
LAAVKFLGITKVFGKDVKAVDDLTLQIDDGEFMVLVGPSGCGKTTALRMIAGLEEATAGDLYIGETRVNDVPPKDRDIAMVFQNYALYPHMTVYKNMAFGLQLRRFPKDEIDRRVREAAQILGLTDDMLLRKPKALSGGQRQRVAVGRAIVRKPKAFLFDEPLSNLDAKMRVSMRTEISKLHTRLSSTMIYVTHDQVEAMTMGDRIVVMKDGRVQQVDSPLEIYNRPVNLFVAGFIGSPPMNFFEGRVIEQAGALWFQESDNKGGVTEMKIRPEDEQTRKLRDYLGKPVVFGIRPEDIDDKLYAAEPNPDHVFKATVEVVEPMGAETYLYLNTGASNFIVRSAGQIHEEVNQKAELVADIKRGHFYQFAPKENFMIKKPEKKNNEFDAERWQASCPLII